MSGPHDAVFSLLHDALAQPAQASRRLKQLFRTHKDLTDVERGVIADTVLGTLCFRRRLQAQAGCDDVDVWAALYWREVRQERPPPWLDDVEVVAQPLPSTTDPAALSIVHSLPEWLVDSWAQRLALADLQELLPFLNAKAPVWARLYDDNAVDVLRADGIEALRHSQLASAATLTSTTGRLNIWGSSAWQQGLFEVQDLGSQLIVHALHDVTGDVLDVCAGAGGKTLALVHDVGKKVFASDVDEQALQNLRARWRRHQRRGAVGLAEIRAGDITTTPLWGRRFDAVVVDAPCSSTGTLRRGPARRWCVAPGDVARHAHLQQRILQAASSLVVDGGVLLYATCSLQRQENEDVVERFLDDNKAFQLESLPFDSELLCAIGGIRDEAMLTLWPHRAGTDGFFMARLRQVGC